MRQRRFRDLRIEDFVVADDGRVLVRRCYPIRWIEDRPTPFPTLYWLADEELVKLISHVERDAWIKRFEARIAADAELAAAYRRDHESYIEERWALSGEHYQRTARAWLDNMDANAEAARVNLEPVYGASEVQRWTQRWRMFFMACEELFGFDAGRQWLVCHYRFGRRS